MMEDTHRGRRSAVLAAALGILVLLSGCGPPDTFSVTVRQDPDSVVLGSQHTPAAQLEPPAQPPQANLDAGSPGFLIPPIPQGVVTLSTPPPQVACPTAPPSQGVTPEATNSSAQAPKPGIYHYRQVGEFAEVGHPLQYYAASTAIEVEKSYVGKLLANGTHDPTDPYIYWDQVEQTFSPGGVPDSTITDTFQLSPGDTGFIKIYQITVKNSAGTDVFQPTQASQSSGLGYGNAQSTGADFIDYPASSLPTWDANAYDVQRQEEFVDWGEVTQKDHVDACGTLLDSWRVSISPTVPAAPMAQPTKQQAVFHYLNNSSLDYTIDGYYDIATQYSGLMVAATITEHSLNQQPCPATGCGPTWINTRTITIDSITPDPLPPS